MTDKTTEALKLAEALENDAKEHREVSYGLDCRPERTANWRHALNCEAAARLIREALTEPVKQKPVAFKFVRYVDGKEMAEGVTIEREKTLDAAIKKAVALCPNRDKTVLVYAAPVDPVKQESVAYVYEKDVAGIGMRKDVAFTKHVEVGTDLYAAPVQQVEQEPFDMDDHPPHRLCECRKCMEYFTPLPDCDAFAAFGKPIAEQTNTQLMEGFRPVSEMIAEHKQDPKKAAAIEKAKMRKAKQEPLMDYERINALREGEQNGAEDAYFFVRPENDTPSLRKMFCQGFERGFHKGLKYAAPVRTKDLTDDEIMKINVDTASIVPTCDRQFHFARAVIAADREKNK